MAARLRPRGVVVPALLWIGFAIIAAPAAAQPADDETDPEQEEMALADSLQLVFEREVFSYPDYQRRNPFQPLTGDEGAGPRFEDLVLLGVVLKANPQESVAVLGARPPGATSDQPTTRTYRLRPGESLGNARILSIDRREVLVEVSDFGVSETRTLTLQRPPPPPPRVPEEELPTGADAGAPAGAGGGPAAGTPTPSDVSPPEDP